MHNTLFYTTDITAKHKLRYYDDNNTNKLPLTHTETAQLQQTVTQDSNEKSIHGPCVTRRSHSFTCYPHTDELNTM